MPPSGGERDGGCMNRQTSASSPSSIRTGALRLATAVALGAGAVVAPVAVAAPASAATCTAGTGPYQRQVEAYLGRVVDGRNSAADCAAIAAFQARYGISPAAGYAGPTTYRVVQRLKSARSRAGLCAPRAKVVCTDLTSQTLWIAERGRITFGPYPMRSGRNGYETRSPVTKRVYWKHIDHVSSIYRSPMPYSMFFDGGEAFHVSNRYLYGEPGSHGCVHILPRIARAMWDRVPVGTYVQVFGRKPGT